MTKVDAIVKGVGQGREAAIRSLVNLDISVESIKDVTPIAHGGVRPKKARRNYNGQRHTINRQDV